MFRYAIIGAGFQGEAIAYDLLRAPDTSSVQLFDSDLARAKAVAKRLRDKRLKARQGHADRYGEMQKIFRRNKIDVVVSAVPYDFNVGLTEAAIVAGSHYCDLGGNVDVVRAQFRLSDLAAEKGVRLLPDCGIAPGAVSVIARHGIDLCGGTADYVKIRVGGLPQLATGPLGYALVFSARGLINECLEDAEIICDGDVQMVRSMDGLEVQEFVHPLGKLEAAYTSGGASTLAQTYRTKVRNLDYKTLRFPGHWDKMIALRDLGFWDDFGPDGIDRSVSPRHLAERLFETKLPRGVPDMLVLRVIVGKDGSEQRFDMIDLADKDTGHSAMQRTTGYSVAICARMLANGEIGGVGALRHEVHVPPERFLAEWRKRGLILSESQ